MSYDTTNLFKKGEQFESDIIAGLRATLPTSHSIFSGLNLYSPKLKKRTEVDILVVTECGLYCIEAKSFRTSINGCLGDAMWDGYSGSYATKIYNPYYQHLMHLRALKFALRKQGVNPVRLISAIVLPNGCSIISNAPNIYTLGSFLAMIEEDNSTNQKIIDVKHFSNIINKVKEAI